MEVDQPVRRCRISYHEWFLNMSITGIQVIFVTSLKAGTTTVRSINSFVSSTLDPTSGLQKPINGWASWWWTCWHISSTTDIHNHQATPTCLPRRVCLVACGYCLVDVLRSRTRLLDAWATLWCMRISIPQTALKDDGCVASPSPSLRRLDAWTSSRVDDDRLHYRYGAPVHFVPLSMNYYEPYSTEEVIIRSWKLQ